MEGKKNSTENNKVTGNEFSPATALAKTFFSRDNTIMRNHEKELSSLSGRFVKQMNDQSPKKRKNGNSESPNFKLPISSSEQNKNSDDEEDNDFDELVDAEKKKQPTILQGSAAQRSYMKACKKLQISPVDTLFVGLSRTSVTVANRFRNSIEVLAYAIGLTLTQTLVDLSIVDNHLNSDMAIYICAALWENTNLSSVALCGNKLDVLSVRAIKDLLTETRHLTRVDLSNNELKGIHCESLTNIFEMNTSIVELNLSHNALDDLCMKQLGKAIGENETIKYLDFSWNCFRTSGIALLCKHLVNNETLLSLNLCMNGAAEDGAGHFSRYLARTTTLRELDLSKNRINDRGYGYFAKLFLKGCPLTKLVIGNNPVSTNGVSLLLNALIKNPNDTLEYLELDGIYLNSETNQLVERLRELMPQLNIVVHGVISKGTDMRGRLLPETLNDLEPMEMFRFYVEKAGSRLIDVFRTMDQTKSNLVSRANFVRGMHLLRIPLAENQIDAIMDELDSEKTGTINFGEYHNANSQWGR